MTIIFWLIASTMTVLVLGLLLWPLLKRTATVGGSLRLYVHGGRGAIGKMAERG